MYDLTFKQATQAYIIRIEANRDLTFLAMQGGIPIMAKIEGLKLNPSLIVKDHPDLEGQPIGEIRKEGVRRLKEHIRTLPTVEDVKEYIKTDLEKHGFKLIIIQRKGFRPQFLK